MDDLISRKALIEDIERSTFSRFIKEILEDFVDDQPTVEVPVKDKWIPVSERLPENETCVLATVWHKSWIADYDSGNEEWWTEHPERYEVCMVYRDGNKYKKLDDADYDNINYIPVAPQEDNLAYPIEVVVAWQPLPAPYQPEGKVE